LIWGALSDERTGLSFTMYNVQYTIHFTVSDLRPGPCIYIPVIKSRYGPHGKHSPSIVECLYVAGVTSQGPQRKHISFLLLPESMLRALSNNRPDYRVNA
jgi:hypothetical protein